MKKKMSKEQSAKTEIVNSPGKDDLHEQREKNQPVEGMLGDSGSSKPNTDSTTGKPGTKAPTK
ncbi:hypothetical protein BH11MYX4_BH11MYX4_16120 [soil metagenome]